jgi:hypothetical protein
MSLYGENLSTIFLRDTKPENLRLKWKFPDIVADSRS